MNTESRLERYYSFDDEVLTRVAQAAERQNRFSFTELADQFDIGAGSEVFVPEGHDKPIEVLTIRPEDSDSYDRSEAAVLHTSFGYPINKNTAMHAVRLFEANPHQQLIVIGNPAYIGLSTGKLGWRDIIKMRREKTLAPAVEPVLAYLKQTGIDRTAHLGYSYGADRVSAAISHSNEFGQDVTHGVMIEPVSVIERSLLRLAKDFGNSGAHQKEYVAQSESKPYDEVWSEDSLTKFAAWALGLVRPSNIVIAGVLASGGFKQRCETGLQNQQNAKITVGWGSHSELVPDDSIDKIVLDLQTAYDERVRAMRLEGMHHAAIDDIDLHAAMMLQGLRA